ncbi:SGNH/GDSL hydrolase family protein [Azotobacter salinestris]|uniref:SGNH/GDSL hydrolase family protein n=1 Tax=Azotobacter salinestris TaxID=69964 RepID=UPI001266B054|nr:SGNH/GDSL hydrolase family protein [Azotobacter salinestris]
MATRYQHRRSTTTAQAPSTLLPGEIAANLTDEVLWVGKADGTPKKLTSFADFLEAVQDLIGTFVKGGTGISVAYNDATGETTITNTGGSGGSSNAPYLLYEFGDSRSYQAWSYTTTIPAPRAASPFWWMEALSRRVKMDYRYVQGVSGNEVAQVKARIQANTANAWGFGPEDLPEPGIVTLLVGTNDITGAVAAGGRTYIDSVLADHLWIVNWALGKGHKVIVITEWPRSGLTADEQKLMQYFVNGLRRQYAGMKDVWVDDPWIETANPSDTTGAAIVGLLNADELHTSPGIGQVQGRRLARLAERMGLPIIHNHCPGSNADLYDATNNPRGCIAGNPMMQGSGGTLGAGASGVAPDGWTLDASGGLSVVGSRETITVDGREYDAFKVVVSGTTSAANAYARIRRSGLLSSVAIGDKLEAGCFVKVLDGHQNFGAPAMVIDPGVTADQVHGGLTVTGDRAPPAAIVEAMDVYPRSERYTVPDPLPASLAVDYRVRFVESGLVSSATAYFISSYFRKV